MGKRADLTDRVKNTGSGLIVSCMNKSDIGISFKCFFDLIKVRKLVNGEFQVDVGKTLAFADLDCS